METSAPPLPLWRRLRRRLYRPLVLLVVGLVPMLFVVGSFVRRSLPDLASRPEYRLVAERITVVDPPPWIPADFVADVLADDELPEAPSLLDDRLVTSLAAAFERSPWVAAVRSVRKSAVGVVAELDFRRPVAVVRIRRVSYPVDAGGVLLPTEEIGGIDPRALPIVADVTTAPGRPGEPWADPVVVGAARIAEAVAASWGELALEGIRLRTSESRGKPPEDLVYELVTTGGSVVVWGRAPGSTHPGELSVRQKLGKIARYLERFESFEKPNGPYEIDIRHWREITRQRIAAVTVERL